MESATISPNPPQLRSMDYAFLREKGIEYLQKISGKLWTDFNLHDPGVTILEILCYAITDLGYRCSFKIEDILASNPDKTGSILDDFPSADQILTCNPYTRDDYRKLLMDIPGIRNAWIEKSCETEKPLYYNPETGALDFAIGLAVPLNGLYTIRMEFEDCDIGDLNTTMMMDLITIAEDSLQYDVEVVFPYWDKISDSWFFNTAISSITLEKIFTYQDDNRKFKDYYAELTVNFTDGIMVEQFSINVTINPKANENNNNAVITALTNALTGTDEESLFNRFKRKIEKIGSIVSEAKAVMNQNRNLCEDFYRFEALKIQEIAVNATIEITAGADPLEVLTLIYCTLDEFFSPRLRFFSLSELLGQELSLDQIFDGPRLRHGFIKTEALKELKRDDILFTSDLIHTIMDISKVRAVSEFSVSNFIFNHAVIPRDGERGEENCILFTALDMYKPKFSIEKSAITITRDGITIAIDEGTLNDQIRTMKNRMTNNNVNKNNVPLDIPKGENRFISDYYSLQHHFPGVYGIGNNGVSEDASDKRKAQARQIQGYLIFFEQLLAHYFSQLAHVRDLFSADPKVEHTYFVQPLFSNPGIRELLKEFTDLQNITSPETGWEDYVYDNPVFTQRLQNIVEERGLFFQRRDCFLNHLLARFGEDFTEYSLYTFSKANEAIVEKLISDKQVFLSEICTLSRNRAGAFNYYQKKSGLPDLWNTSNVSGIEKRIARLLGITRYNRRSLYNEICGYFETYEEIDDDDLVEYRFRLCDDQGNILLSSSTRYRDLSLLNSEIESVISFGERQDRYEILPAANGSFYFNLLDDKNEVIARRIEIFATYEDAREAADTVFQFILNKNGGEGFHLIEHILLRPKNSSYNLLPLSSMDINHDPYSFRVTIVLPDYSGRFRDQEFRRLIAKSLLSELPAHILVQIHWINRECMGLFENVYKNWLQSCFDDTVDENRKVYHHNAFVQWFTDQIISVTSPDSSEGLYR